MSLLPTRLKLLLRQTFDSVVVVPWEIATSRTAQKAYAGTVLLVAAAVGLLFVSAGAYLVFYWGFVPQVGVERVVFLQFGDGNPHGTASLDSTLTTLQPYDITLHLHLPRTPSNLAAGNFMLTLSLLSALPSPTKDNPLIPSTPKPQKILAQSRRPAILTYSSAIVDAASTLTGLPWYVLGWKSESEVLEVPMFEGVEFPRGGGGGNVPRSLELVVESGGEGKMQFYEVGVRIVARFGGLRWIMYHHRIVSFLLFTSVFWTSSMLSALLAWFILSTYLPSPEPTPTAVTKKEEAPAAIKTEPSESEPYEPYLTEGLSDTSRIFPALGRLKPLQFTGRGGGDRGREEDPVKKEEEEEVLQTTSVVQPLGAEADDEDDDFGVASGFKDSGIGTSLDEAQRTAQAQQRRRKPSAVW
ncbi:MAG: hypothetical protein LQ350_006594 [Teloschistes chrysophthalmus]|nr:MAG: hypothetical protein LQ350_006594 [Niorma chrysophthalma]